MPRRESARRNHPLARECDIIETLHMRLTLLQMTFGKHIERKHICFFPGEVRLLFLIALKPDCLSYFADIVSKGTPNNQISTALSWQKQK